ncbi:zinc finger protein RFP-like [Podarcis raffonei]|uniref:zinc finger protein RFP-like n=1 Tax=Podarcis raffonei TaxID=65483 RepID=UPI00232970B2|nr:zinc finger protein RFP-like [Podarcis raffonei]
MASVLLTRQFLDETSCPICLDYFTDPVILDCGHSFCKACLTMCWKETQRPASCPHCRQVAQRTSFRPNRQLANVVEIAKQFTSQAETTNCKRHGEPLEFFCNVCVAPTCNVCKRSQEHSEHDMFNLDGISQKIKQGIQARVQFLMQERQVVRQWKLAEEERVKAFPAELEEEKNKISGAFEQMHNFLHELQRFWLTELEDLEKEMKTKKESNIVKLSQDIAFLSSHITDMEKKRQLPPFEFLRGFGTSVIRFVQWKKKRAVLGISTGMEERLISYTQKNSFLQDTLEKCKGLLMEAPNKVSVTLDPGTAHPFLVVTEDLKNLRRRREMQDVQDNPGRFNSMLYALGHAKFTSGRYWWEVVVEEEKEERERANWAVGVAKESVRRKGFVRMIPSEGIWAIGKGKDESASSDPFWASTLPERTPLSLSYEPRKIRVSLDYDQGCVEFYNAHTDDLIFKFQRASFSGEKVQPFFHVWWGAGLKC